MLGRQDRRLQCLSCPLSAQHRPLANSVDPISSRCVPADPRPRPRFGNPTARPALLKDRSASPSHPALRLAPNMLSFKARHQFAIHLRRTPCPAIPRQLSCRLSVHRHALGGHRSLRGTWKLNPAKSKLIDQMKVEAAGTTPTPSTSPHQSRDHRRRRYRPARHFWDHPCGHSPRSQPMESRPQKRRPNAHLCHLGSFCGRQHSYR